LSPEHVHIFGNWKMAQSWQGAQNFVSQFKESSDQDVEIQIFASALHLSPLMAKSPAWKLGAQDCSAEDTGAFTGQISAAQLLELGVKDVLLGHSECRARGDDEALLRQKLQRATEAGLRVCFCVGEGLEDRESGRLWPHLERQLEVLKDYQGGVIVAYEPIWAIGTGKNATPEQIQEVHAGIRERLPDLRVLYGGSVKPENASQILKLPDVHGLLIGGASLKAESLEKIVQLARLR